MNTHNMRFYGEIWTVIHNDHQIPTVVYLFSVNHLQVISNASAFAVSIIFRKPEVQPIISQ